MKNRKLLCICAIIGLLCIYHKSRASTPNKPVSSVRATKLMHQNKALFFEENKGQLQDADRNPIADVKYYGHSNGVYLYCKPGLLSFVFTKVENGKNISEATGMLSPAGGGRGWKNHDTPKPSKITTSRTDLVLVGSNPNAEIIATDQQEYYENFYTTGDADHGITNVHTYKTITYQSIYPHIDMVFLAKGEGMEYSFVVHPGGKVSDIQMRWNGIEDAKTLQCGGFKYNNSLGSLEESAPKSFQNGKVLESRFWKNGFKVGKYDERKDLIIDPTLGWGTYYGGSNTEIAYGVNTDIHGYVYVTGCTLSNSKISTGGAYQTFFSGGTYNGDVFLSKFTKNGAIAWATYYGGAGDDIGYGVATDSSDNSYVTGVTDSSIGIATSGSYQTSFGGGGKDAFIAKFNKNGIIQWSTYYGGASYENAYGIITDNSGYLYITGATGSSSGVVTSGAFQTFLSGGEDAFLAKFNTVGTIQWSTYFGGTGGDIARGVAIDGSGNLYITGITQSNSGLATKGAYCTSNSGGNGNQDAFLAKFTGNGNLKWATYYGGKGDDFGLGTATDNSGGVYITGFSYGSIGLATSGEYQTSIISNSEPDFLAKFNSNGAIQWATYYGDGDVYMSSGIATDFIGNVYITGGTINSTGIATKGAFQSYYSGANSSDYNTYLAEFEGNGSLRWATYYGGSTNEYGNSVTSDNLGNVYVAGITSSSSGIQTSGAYQTQYGGGGSDAFVAKFSGFVFSNDAGIDSIKYPNGNFCSEKDSVRVQLKNYGLSTLTKVNIQWSVNSKSQTTYSWFGNLKPDSTIIVSLGVYDFEGYLDTVRAWTSNPNGITDSIPQNDSSLAIDTIISPAAIYSATVGKCGVVSFQASPSPTSPTSITNYSWNGQGSPSSIPLSFTGRTGSYQYKTGNEYYRYNLTVTGSNGCSRGYNDSVQIKPLVQIKLPNDTTVCTNTSLTISAIPVNAFKPYQIWWNWKDAHGDSLTTGSITEIITKDTSIRVNILDQGCTAYDSMKIKVNPLPISQPGKAQTICEGTRTSIGASKDSGITYQWSSNPLGFTSTASNPMVSPSSTITYKLAETNSFGCLGIDSVTITVNTLPEVSLISDTTICSGTPISIGASAVAGSTYSWISSPIGFTSTSSNPSVSPTSTTIYKLTETNSNGCSATDSVTITVNPLPTVKVISNTFICSGSSVSIGGSAVSGDKYYWISSPAGFTSTSSNPSVSPTSTTTYKLKETNSNGCTAIDSVIIAVNQLPSGTIISNTAICSGSSISIGGASVSGSTYSWTSTTSGFSSTSSNPSVSPLSATTYYLKETIQATGCADSDSVKISVNPVPKSAFSYTNVCMGDSSSFIDSSHLASSYEWYFGDGGKSTLTNPKHLYASKGNYTVSLKVTSNAGCTDSVSKSISLSSCVWPGDANNDKTVDMKDLLAIGIAYGTIGHPRPSASISWTGQPSQDWDSSFASGVNYKFADCNGDSIINHYDTLAVSTNYGDSHSKSGSANQGNSSDPGLSIKYLNDTVYAGDTLIAQIVLGSASKPVANLYGLAFSVALDPAVFDINKTILKLTPSFLGTNGTDLMAMYKNNASSGSIDIGLSRINQQNVSGNGVIGTLYIPIKATLPKKSMKASLALSNNIQISHDEKNVPMYLSSDSVLLKQDKTGIDNFNSSSPFSLNIYPNPFTDKTLINFTLSEASHVKISIMDMKGNTIFIPADKTYNSGPNEVEINATEAGLLPGTYFVNVMINGQFISKKIIEVR